MLFTLVLFETFLKTYNTPMFQGLSADVYYFIYKQGDGSKICLKTTTMLNGNRLEMYDLTQKGGARLRLLISPQNLLSITS